MAKDVGCLLNIIDATLMNFIVIGEMTSKISEALIRETHDQIDWFKMKGFRNIIAHNYFGVDAEEVWQIIQDKLPVLKAQLLTIMGNECLVGAYGNPATSTHKSSL